MKEDGSTPKNVGKKRFPVSKTAMKKVLEEKLGEHGFGNEYFIRAMSQSGYGRRYTKKSHSRKHKKTRKHRRV